MSSLSAGPVEVYFEPSEQATAQSVAAASGKSVRLNADLWGLGAPAHCRVSVVTSWPRFLRETGPAYLRWWGRGGQAAQRTPDAASQMRWQHTESLILPRRAALGVLPAQALGQVSSPLRSGILYPQDDLDIRLEHLVCHGLTHLFAAAARLPWWLEQGLALFTTDAFAGQPTVQSRTLSLLRRRWFRSVPVAACELSRMAPDEAVYHVVRGYWIVRYLQAVRPGLLRQTLSQQRGARAIENALAVALGSKMPRFWYDIDRVLTGHYDTAMFAR